ncbi:hypothetical protein HispidOSU_020711 [Sigmodon hispidus]
MSGSRAAGGMSVQGCGPAPRRRFTCEGSWQRGQARLLHEPKHKHSGSSAENTSAGSATLSHVAKYAVRSLPLRPFPGVPQRPPKGRGRRHVTSPSAISPALSALRLKPRSPALTGAVYIRTDVSRFPQRQERSGRGLRHVSSPAVLDGGPQVLVQPSYPGPALISAIVVRAVVAVRRG